MIILNDLVLIPSQNEIIIEILRLRNFKIPKLSNHVIAVRFKSLCKILFSNANIMDS